MTEINPDELLELEKSTLANIVAKVAAGGVPTVRESKLLRAAAGLPDEAPAPPVVDPAVSRFRAPEFKADALAKLRKLNPRKAAADLLIYVDALIDYLEAQANVDERGTVVPHPKSGAPIDNPYLRVRSNAARTIREIGLRADPLWGVA